MVRLFIIVSVAIAILTSTSAWASPALAANGSSVSAESLRELISGDNAEYTLIQPGSEMFNLATKNVEDIWIKVIRKISDFLLGINRWLDSRLSGIPQIRSSYKLTNINWFVAILVVAILAYFFASVIPAFRRGRRDQIMESDQDKTISLSMSAALQRSDMHARANNLHKACKELLVGFLMGLDEVDRIPYRTSRTNREYQRAIRRRAPEHHSFAQRFLPFMDGILYAGNTANENDYLEFRNVLKQSFHV
jgi:hypothetical protein